MEAEILQCSLENVVEPVQTEREREGLTQKCKEQSSTLGGYSTSQGTELQVQITKYSAMILLLKSASTFHLSLYGLPAEQNLVIICTRQVDTVQSCSPSW